jgi:uncharacterized lipoprotein YddW (UPF0748 family)
MKYGAYYQQEDERFARHDTGVVHQPKFRAYMVDLMAGLVEDYDVDGVHLDRIRTNGICFNNEPLDYPGTEFDYPGCQQDYQTWTQENYGQAYTLWDDTDGHSKIEDEDSGRVAAWQEQGLALLVKSIHDELKAIRPDLIISVASMRNDPSPEVKRLDSSGQVAWEWLDQGWIDVAFVATYVENTQGVINKIDRFRAAVEDENLHSRVFPGLLTYDLDDKENRVDLLVEQVNAVMYGQWTGQKLETPVRGMALFRDKVFSKEAVTALAEKAFTEPALPYWGEDRLISETIPSP